MARNLLVAALFTVLLASVLVDSKPGHRTRRDAPTTQQVASLMPVILENMIRASPTTKNLGLNGFIQVLQEVNRLQKLGPLTTAQIGDLLDKGLKAIALATETSEANVNQVKALIQQGGGVVGSTVDFNSLKRLVAEALWFLGNGTVAGTQGVNSMFIAYAVDPSVKVATTAAKTAAAKKSGSAALSILSKPKVAG